MTEVEFDYCVSLMRNWSMTEYKIWVEVPGCTSEMTIYFSNAAKMVEVTKEWESMGVRVLSAIPLRKYS